MHIGPFQSIIKTAYDMLMKKFISLKIAAVLPWHVTAHLMIDVPVPYGKATLNNSPLDDAGSDFPCKLRAGVYDVTERNYWTAGEMQKIRFVGSAVHGGGSCQFSITEDQQPAKSSQWKVIHSVVGGCPVTGEGNLEGGPASHVTNPIDFLLPENIPSGNYTFAWTWFNSQGPREMYMNCAPITINGGGNDRNFLATLPDMFVANLPSSDCSTIENFAYVFPNPGNFAVTMSQASLTTELAGTGCASITILGGGSREVLVNTARHSTFTTESRAEVTKAAKNVSVPKHMSDVMSDAAIVSISAFTSSTSASIATTNLPHMSSACIPCEFEGNFICIDPDHFGVCNLGCALSQPVALGTACLDGRIVNRQAPSMFE